VLPHSPESAICRVSGAAGGRFLHRADDRAVRGLSLSARLTRIPRRNPRLYSELHAGKFEVLSVDDDPVNQVGHRWFDPVYLDMDPSPSWTTKLHVSESDIRKVKDTSTFGGADRQDTLFRSIFPGSC
jgi:hypothetical protein